jgi:hypothetical protein
MYARKSPGLTWRDNAQAVEITAALSNFKEFGKRQREITVQGSSTGGLFPEKEGEYVKALVVENSKDEIVRAFKLDDSTDRKVQEAASEAARILSNFDARARASRSRGIWYRDSAAVTGTEDISHNSSRVTTLSGDTKPRDAVITMMPGTPGGGSA